MRTSKDNMPHPKTNNQLIELDDEWEDYKRRRHVYADRASYKGFKKLDDMQQALLKMLRKGLQHAEPQYKNLWLKEYHLAKKDREWVLDSPQEPLSTPASPVESPVASPRKKKPSAALEPSSESESETSSVVSESSRSSQDTQRKGLEDDSHKHEINDALVALSRKYKIHERALVLDAPESKLSSKALSRIFKQIDVPNMTITAKDARDMSKGPVKWFASQAFDHLAHSEKAQDLIYLDQCGSFLTQMKDVVLAIQKLEKGRPVLFATTFFTSRIPSETKHQWKTEHVHQIQAIFEGSLNVKVHETSTFEYRKMVTNVWVLEKT